MKSDRWRRIEELYHAALDRPAEQRSAFLASECVADPELLREVQELIDHDEGQNSFVDRPAWERGAGLVEVELIASGTLVGPYRIEEALGKGGMGIVYRAEDTRLGRRVAIKFLRHGAVSAEFGQRLQREAKAISSLNHPNVCALFDIGSYNGSDYLVMEYARGETLRSRLSRGNMPQSVALRTAIQIADGLAAAHANGIIHRDLKPENVMLTDSGAKVLDFGLAKISGSSANRPPTGSNLTVDGAIMGTPAYMAPEQIEGKPTDERTDIFAFGLVVYEMLSGRKAFAEESSARLAAAILTHPPDLSAISGHPLIARAVQNCIEKEPSRRWQSVKDIRQVLEWCLESLPGPQHAAKPAKVWLYIAAVTLLALISGSLLLRREPQDSPSVRFAISLPKLDETINAPLPSPDGSSLAFLARSEDGTRAVHIRQLDSERVVSLPGTERAVHLAWSPDGKWIAFFSEGKLKKVRVSGGKAHTITHSGEAFGLAWGSRGDIIYAAGNRTPLMMVRDSGGTARQITKLDSSRGENSHRWPTFLPDGKHFLYLARSTRRENHALYLGSLDSGTSVVLGAIQSNAAYVPANGDRGAGILYVRDNVLLFQPFDGARLTGDPVPVADGIEYAAGSTLGVFRASQDGRTITYSLEGAGFNQLTVFDRGGNRSSVIGAPGPLGQPRFSPDGFKVAVNRPDRFAGTRDIWIVDAKTGAESRVTSNSANDWFPVWSPDGKQMAFGSDRKGGPGHQTYVKHTLDSESAEAPLQGKEGRDDDGAPYDWSRDGRWMALVYYTPTNLSDIRIAQANAPSKAVPYLATEFNEASPRFSPDGRWLAYVSDESGGTDVYVRPFHGQSYAPEGKIRVSSGGGDHPVWGPTGKELFFMAENTAIYSADMSRLNDRHVVGPPQKLFQPCTATGVRFQVARFAPYAWHFDVAPDGRFVVDCMAEPPGRFMVWMNWRAGESRPSSDSVELR